MQVDADLNRDFEAYLNQPDTDKRAVAAGWVDGPFVPSQAALAEAKLMRGYYLLCVLAVR